MGKEKDLGASEMLPEEDGSVNSGIRGLYKCGTVADVTSIAGAFGVPVESVLEVDCNNLCNANNTNQRQLMATNEADSSISGNGEGCDLEDMAKHLAFEVPHGVLLLRNAHHRILVPLLSTMGSLFGVTREASNGANSPRFPVTLVLDGWTSPFVVEDTRGDVNRQGLFCKLPVAMLPGVLTPPPAKAAHAREILEQQIEEVCCECPMSAETATGIIEAFMSISGGANSISEELLSKALFEMGANTDAGVLVVTPSLRHRVFTYFDRSSLGVIRLDDFAAAVATLGAPGNAITRMRFIHHIMSGDDMMLRLEDCRTFFEMFIVSQENITTKSLAGVRSAAMQWIENFFAVSGHECLSEEALRVFLDAPHPGDYTTMPEPVAVSKLMIWRSVGDFCSWWDFKRNIVRLPTSDVMSREAYFKGSLWESTKITPHTETFTNINRSRLERLGKQDAHTLAVLCGYTGVFCESFAGSFVDLNERQFSKQMEEIQYFAPFPTSTRHKVPRPTEPQVAKEWIKFIQAAARLMDDTSRANSRSQVSDDRGCRSAARGCRSEKCAVM